MVDGVPEAEARMVEGIYETTTAIVAVGEGSLEEFEVKIGLRKGSMLSPLLSVAILDLTSRKTITKDTNEQTPLCGRPGPGGEWQTGATGDTVGVERVGYQTLTDTLPIEDGSIAHRPPEADSGGPISCI